VEFSVQEVRNRVEALRTVGDQFEANLRKLLSLESAARLDPSAWTNWNALVNRGVNVKAAISKGVAAVQDAAEWIKQTTGLSLSGLGFAPLAIVAVMGAIAAAIALAIAWNNDANSEIRKLEILQASVAELPPEQRARILSEAAGRQKATFTGDLAKMAMYLMGAAAIVFVLPRLLERR
jgi:hypothetical protein